MKLPSRRVLLFASLPLLLVALGIAIFFLAQQLKKETPPPPIQTDQPKIGDGAPATLTLPRSSENNPIKKTYIDVGKKVRYSIKGKIVEPLEEANGVWQGALVLSGDPLQRKITVLVGSGDDQIYLGRYVGGFNGDSSWSVTPMNDVLTQYQYEEELEFILEIDLPLPDYDQNLEPKIVLLDALQSAFESGEHDSVEIPTTFAIYSYQVGYVAQ